MIGKKENAGPLWESLLEQIGVEEPTPLPSQVFWVAPREKQKLITVVFKQSQAYSSKIVPKRIANLREKTMSAQKLAETPCTDDHFSLGYFSSTGEVAPTSAQIVFV